MKKTPATTKAMTSAVNSADSTDALVLTNKATPSTTARKFTGTSNPRELRAIDALMNAAAVSRYDLDSIVGTTNSPEVISRLRAKGLTIPCERFDLTDRDGDKCRPGEYSLTDDDRRMVTAWHESEGK